MLLLRQVSRLSGVEGRFCKAFSLLVALMILPLCAHAALSGWAYGWNISSTSACPDQGEGFNCENSSPPYYHIGTIEGGIAQGTTTIASGSFVEILTLFDFHGDTKLINRGTLIASDFQVGIGPYWDYSGYANLEMINTGAFDVTTHASIGGGGGSGTFNVTGGTIKMVHIVLGDFGDLTHPYTGAFIARGTGNVSAADVTSFKITNDLHVANGDFQVLRSTLEVGAISIAIGTDSSGTMTVKGTRDGNGPALKVDKNVLIGFQGGDATWVADDTSVSIANDLTVGDQGKGQLTVSGSVFSVKGFVSIGWNKDGDGSASFTGNKDKKTEVNIDKNLAIGGNGGKGRTTIDQATLAVKENVIVGYLNDSNGTLTVTGNPDDETFPVTPHVKIGGHLLIGEGKAKSATMNVKDKAHIAVALDVALGDKGKATFTDSLLTVDGAMIVSRSESDVSSVTIDGGSRLSRATIQTPIDGRYPGVEFVSVGNDGQGSLDVKDNSQVFARILSVGHNQSGKGALTIVGQTSANEPTSIVRVTEDLLVGYRGAGITTVESGGKLAVGRYLAVGYETRIAELHVKSGGTVELFHTKGEALDHPFNVGRTELGHGTVRVDEGGVLRLQGDGNLLSVYRGTATLAGTAKIELDGKTNIIGMGMDGLTSTMTLGGKVEVSLNDEYKPKAGDFFPVFNARTITFQGVRTPGYARNWNASSGTVQIGDLSIQTIPVDGIASAGARLVPEHLRIGCEGLTSGAIPCGADALSLRVFSSASGAITGAGANRPLTDIDEATAFIESERTSSGASISNEIYQMAQPGGREIAYLQLDSLRAAAIQTPYRNGSGEISIVIRGTDGLNATNWNANIGFTGMTDTMRAYLRNLSSFTAGVIATNPDADIRFVGHSLGGGLALILGAESGFDAFGFNAPHIGTLQSNRSAYAEDVLPIVGLRNRSGFDHIVNVRVLGDPVSALNLGKVGQEITIVEDPFEYFVYGPHSWLESLTPAERAYVEIIKGQIYSTVRRALEQHRIETVLDALASDSMNVVELCTGAGCVTRIPSVDILRDRVFFPDSRSGPDLGNFVDRPVEKSVLYLLDPASYPGFVFESAAASPAFESVIAPDVGIDDLQYELQILEDGTWRALAVIIPGERMYFPEGETRRFRLIPSQPVQIVDSLFFGVSFASSGQFTGSITAVPEPETYVTMLCGLLLLFSYGALTGHRGIGQRPLRR